MPEHFSGWIKQIAVRESYSAAHPFNELFGIAPCSCILQREFRLLLRHNLAETSPWARVRELKYH
jgi:hypothetical protein